MAQNIVITGAAGFIGSSFANNANKNKEYNLTLIDSLEFGNIENLDEELRDNLIVTDCLNINFLRNIIPKEAIVFHFAGISSLPECESNYISSINNIFNSTVNVYEVGISMGMKKFVFASTSAVYENNKKFPFNEDEDVDPDLMYSYSKKICENYLRFRSLKLDSVDTFVLRFFNVFGYNQDTLRKNPPLTAYLIKCIKDNVNAVIYNDNPSIKRDYIFINDLIEILYGTIKIDCSDKFQVVNVTSGNSYSVDDIIRILKMITNKDLSFTYLKPQNIWSKYPDVLNKITTERISREVYKTSLGDNKKVMKYLNESHSFITMEEGLKLMIESQI